MAQEILLALYIWALAEAMLLLQMEALFLVLHKQQTLLG